MDILVPLVRKFHCSCLNPASSACCLERINSRTKSFSLLSFVIILENVSEVRGFRWSYSQLLSREGDPPPNMRVITPVLNTLLAIYRMGTCSVSYFMSGNELVYQKRSSRTLHVLGHKYNHREIYKFLYFTNIL